jgi:hypothetical protein
MVSSLIRYYLQQDIGESDLQKDVYKLNYWLAYYEIGRHSRLLISHKAYKGLEASKVE